MIAQMLIKHFTFSHLTVEKNIDGISHGESLVQPKPAGNCVNWVMGHIAVHRNPIGKLVGLEPVLDEAIEKRYTRASQPMVDAGEAIELDDFIAAYRRSQEQLMARLGSMTDADLSQKLDDDTLAEKLAGFAFHEAYHAGQLGVIRRVIGKDGILT